MSQRRIVLLRPSCSVPALLVQSLEDEFFSSDNKLEITRHTGMRNEFPLFWRLSCLIPRLLPRIRETVFTNPELRKPLKRLTRNQSVVCRQQAAGDLIFDRM